MIARERRGASIGQFSLIEIMLRRGKMSDTLVRFVATRHGPQAPLLLPRSHRLSSPSWTVVGVPLRVLIVSVLPFT
jgi:hypothetical protein